MIEKTVYRIGDRDTTYHGEKCCDATDSEWGFICTRRPHHSGNHAAGNEVEICHVWPQTMGERRGGGVA